MSDSDRSQPMREPTLLLIAALADAPRHGYALIGEVARISGGRVTLRAGTLYGALDRLLHQGLVRVDREEVVDGRARRTYALTDAGRAALDVEVQRMEAITREARRRMGSPTAGPVGATA
ncbi:PadR family transcriptional regulator (plasmid) [Streptomyces sp. Q6]|uniref:PadR family transcriptional regulator n=1 Tax=Streptomyces citrinus TaxID=3118173 RepID=A0ACD5AQ33_9ACTN